MTHPTLYKLDSQGDVREWDITIHDNGFTVSYGIQDGKKISKTTVCKPKNIRKANETTAAQQAVIEGKAKWVKQKDRECYLLDLNDKPPYIQPMLARDAMKLPKQINWEEEWFSQMKLDGVRGVFDPTVRGKIQSRKGTFYSLEHLYNQLSELEIACEISKGFNFDGEVYLHGVPLNEINGACKKFDPELTPFLEFHIFDLANRNATPYWIRRRTLLAVGRKIEELGLTHVKVVESSTIKKDNLESTYEDAAERGYEGIMLRKADGPYGLGERPDVLYKYKGEFMDEEFFIVDVEADKDGGAVLVFKSPEGADETKPTFKARPKGTNAYRAKLLAESALIIGKKGTVKFFDYTPYGIPQFPVCIDIDPVK